MVRIKHASNDPRGDKPISDEPDLVLRPRYFKSLEIQRRWVPEFKERHIITGREFERNFPLKYYRKMLALMNAIGWNNIRPFPKRVYSKLVRLFYYNLEVGNLKTSSTSLTQKLEAKP